MKAKEIYRKEKEKHECPICLRKIKYRIKTQCKHMFCDICIVKHLMMKDVCPMCRTVCNYEYITQQIRVKRQKYLMRKLIPPVETTHIQEPIQPISVYSRFIPMYLPASIIMIALFTIELIIVIYLAVVITETVISMLSM
jgi:hypothetical protein